GARSGRPLRASARSSRSSFARPSRRSSTATDVFTGLVREVGTVVSVHGGETVRLELEAPATAAASVIGDSIAIDGVCLTVVSADDGLLAFDAVPETVRRTALGSLTRGSRVNLAPALPARDPRGGH